MARKKSPTTDLLPEVTINPEAGVAQNIMSAVSSQYNDERDLVNQLLGQVQMANAISRFSDVVGLTKLKYIKENKLYQHLKGRKAIAPDGSEISDVGTFEGFCKALGLSYSKVHEDLTNLSTFGEDALKQLSAVGAGYRELRQFRRLPEDQKSALIEVAKEGDKNALLELAEEMIAKHAREKEELKTDLEISRQILAEKKEELALARTEKEELRNKLIRRTSTETPDEEGKAIEIEGLGLKNAVQSNIIDLQKIFEALSNHTDQTGIDHIQIMTAIIDNIEADLINLRNQFNISQYRALDAIPDWTKEANDTKAIHN